MHDGRGGKSRSESKRGDDGVADGSPACNGVFPRVRRRGDLQKICPPQSIFICSAPYRERLVVLLLSQHVEEFAASSITVRHEAACCQ
jgi:hypothetical protein